MPVLPIEEGNYFTSRYLDVPNTPLYPFGYGLSYTNFQYTEISLNKNNMTHSDTLVASVTVKNTGDYEGQEVVQLYIRDLVGSVTRPVKELKGFKKISLKPDAEKTVEFQLTAEDLRFYNADMNFVAEPGDFKLFIGSSSADVQEERFSLAGK